MADHITPELVETAAWVLGAAALLPPTGPDERSWTVEARAVLEAVAPLIDRAARADELDAVARDLYRRSDNVPLDRSGSGIERVGTLRETADRLKARADSARAAAFLAAPTEEN